MPDKGGYDYGCATPRREKVLTGTFSVTKRGTLRARYARRGIRVVFREPS